MARNTLRALGKSIHQCFKELTAEMSEKDWTTWAEVKKDLTEQTGENVMKREKIKSLLGELAEKDEDTRKQVEGKEFIQGESNETGDR